MSIGGATGDGTLPDPDKAREFAHTLFDLFLGGSRYTKIRPFGRYVQIFLVCNKVKAEADVKEIALGFKASLSPLPLQLKNIRLEASKRFSTFPSAPLNGARKDILRLISRMSPFCRNRH